jgi:hypothetical protein
MKIDCIKNYDVYKNESLQITLKIEKSGNTQDWIVMKKSSVVDGGFGVFALREFKQSEFVTAYMGKPVDYTYMHGEIVSLPTTCSIQGIHEEYWLGHRINHGSGKKKNVEI